MGLDEWRKFVHDLRLADHILTPRLVTLVFVWSRMRVVDEAKRRVRLTNHHFEDFLESLVRVASIKPWPSAEQIRQVGCGQLTLTLTLTPTLTPTLTIP